MEAPVGYGEDRGGVSHRNTSSERLVDEMRFSR